MTRPKKTIPPAKECQITIRMTQDLYDVITKDAKDAKMPRTEYIRHVLSGRTPSVKYEIVYNNPEILKIFRNLGNIAGNLNQISRHLNQGDAFTRELKQEVSGCIAQILHIRDQVKEMVGEYRGNSETHSDS